MNALILVATLVGNLTITSYRPVKNQTDSSPFFTSTGEKVRAGGCAVSRDQLCRACRRLHHRCRHPENSTKLHYGDWLYITKYGFRQINDVMGDRQHYAIHTKNGRKVMFKTIRKALDIFVEKWSEEHSVGVQHLTVHKIKGELK